MDKKERLFYVLLGVFVLWLVAILFWIAPSLWLFPEAADPTMQVISALGVGSITQALIVLLTLSWQYWFRKKPSGTNDTPASGKS